MNGCIVKTTITKMAAKDGDQVSTTHSSTETLSDILQKIMLGPLKENQEAVEDKAIEFSQLVAQLKSSKSGKAELLEETAAMVKAFLKQKNKDNNVGLLLGTKEFMPFLGKSLRIKFSSNSKLLMNVLVIIQTILQHGHGKNLELTKKLRITDLIPQLMQFFDSPDPGVLENVALTFSTIAYHPEIRHVLMSEPNCSTLIKTLTKVLNSSNPSERLLQFIGSTLEGLSLGGTSTLEEDKENVNLRASLPPLPIIKSIMPLISRLCDIGNVQTRRSMLECICVSLVVLKDLNLFIKHGLSSKLVTYLADLNQNHLMGAAVALGSIACNGPAELLKFLISLKDTQGLRNYWKCMQLDEDFGGNERLHAGLSNFVNSVGSLIFLDRYDCAEVNIVIDSGYAHALAGCLKNDCRQAFKINAITMLGSICASPELPNSKREVIVQLDILPEAIEYMKSANPQAMASAAMLVTRLVDNSLERRDKAIELGAMTILLGNIRKHFANPMIIYNSMIAVEGLLKVCPPPPIEVFKCALVTITDIFHMVFTPRFDLMTIAVDCLREFIGYGRTGVDAILKTPRLANKIIAYLYSSPSDLQAASVVLLRELCETGNSEHRRQFLELGALDNFTSILQVESNETRQWALECLLILLQEELTCGQKQAVQRLRDLVKAEICKKIPETYESARAVYSKMIL